MDTGKNLQKNLPKVDFDTLKIFFKNKDIMVQKTVEGSKLVILIRKFYPCEKNIVNDTLKFEKVISHDKLLNQAIHMENRVTDVLKNVRDKKKKKKKKKILMSNIRI